MKAEEYLADVKMRPRNKLEVERPGKSLLEEVQRNRMAAKKYVCLRLTIGQLCNLGGVGSFRLENFQQEHWLPAMAERNRCCCEPMLSFSPQRDVILGFKQHPMSQQEGSEFLGREFQFAVQLMSARQRKFREGAAGTFGRQQSKRYFGSLNCLRISSEIAITDGFIQQDGGPRFVIGTGDPEALKLLKSLLRVARLANQVDLSNFIPIGQAGTPVCI